MRVPRLLLYLILAGMLARVVYLNQVASLPFFQDPVGDSARYLDRAQEILNGDPLGDRPFFYGGIFYPWLLALSRTIFGANLYPVCLAQALAGCALAWVLHRFASVAGASRPTALLAAGLCLFYGPFAFFEADVLMISWTLLLLMSAALLLLAGAGTAGGRPISVTRLALAGFCLGLAATERPNLIALVPVLAAWIFVFAPAPGRLRGAATLAASAAAVILCVALLNHAASGRWVLLTTSSGINFYIGNHPGARGTFDEPWSGADAAFTAEHPDLEEASLTMARRMSGRNLDPVEASRYWFSRGIRYLGEQPSDAARLFARKLALFWSAGEIPNHLDFAFLREIAPALWLMPLTFGLVAPLGLYGLFSGESRLRMTRQGAAMLAVLVLVPMGSVLPFFVADRYRVVVVPPLLVAAAFGAAALVRGMSGRFTRRRTMLHLACIVLAGLAMRAPLAEFDRSRDEWLMAQAFRKQGKLQDAARYYERALKTAPPDASAALIHNNLGVVLAEMGDIEGAEREYGNALQIGSGLKLPHRNLGLLLMRHGPQRALEAFEHLDLAERADPGDVEVARALAVLHLERGDPEGARARALKVLEAIPGDASARAVLDKVAARALP